MQTIPDKAACLFENVVVCGDLNYDLLHPLNNNIQGRCLMDIFDVYDLDSLINIPARIFCFVLFCFRTFRNLVGFQGVKITGLEVLCKDLTPGPTV